MAETSTRSWVAEEARRAKRIARQVKFYGCPTTKDVEVLADSVERMAAEVERLHGVIRNYQRGDSRA